MEASRPTGDGPSEEMAMSVANGNVASVAKVRGDVQQASIGGL